MTSYFKHSSCFCGGMCRVMRKWARKSEGATTLLPITLPDVVSVFKTLSLRVLIVNLQ